jgi:hypothetical protein
MGFSAKLFTIKVNLVFMNSLYHKIAVASVCTALSFILGANKEAKATTFTLTATPFFIYGSSDIRNSSYNRFSTDYFVEDQLDTYGVSYSSNRAFYEFNIGNLSLDTNTVIRSAILNTPLSNVYLGIGARSLNLNVSGYIGNGIANLSDFNAGRFIDSQSAIGRYYYPSVPFPLSEVNFNVTNFINQLVSNGDDFAGLSISVENFPRNDGRVTPRSSSGQEPSLIIETVDVPEPTTIFGSALALGVGGWLKRKKSSRQNKTTPQN